jgi:hypothetical protein
MERRKGHAEGVLVTPRALRYLHTLGAIFALLALFVLGLFRISPAGEELLPKAGVFAAMVPCSSATSRTHTGALQRS